ncbi:uncharacterized protein N0V89_001405 [Didymosphaeria variabile]|uniref:Heterokaryon incompatibility domain-containing protein n=1 Tax=Didymosphaeria variabile TaxID=1932322 RepID=A0A9W8XWH6_9PLEO|nr:uncharacterized protein N0V89_001405 [Didymosphaeria variabile]KAJ4360838.1 hypothetical protein N0V89_001405 [Didymosphaeria variabile]
MDYIYEQAFATIVALGENANVGLPGVDGGPRRHPQLVAEFGPVRLLSRCPTLSSQINDSVWLSRGWTYQEGLFSRRCLFFSEHQVYFHCNNMLCTEDSPSAVYVSAVTDPKNMAKENPYWNADRNYIRSNTLWTGKLAGSIYTYVEYLGQYVCRDVSYDSDAVNAFGAVLSRLQRDSFPNGFVHGIPRDTFREGLLWSAAGNISRRASGGFPSWTWAAWKTGKSGITYGPVAAANDDQSSTIVPHPLSISLGQNNLYRSQTTNMRLSDSGLELQALWGAYSNSHKSLPPRKVPRSITADALYIDGPIVSLPVTYNAATQVVGFTAPPHLPKVRMMEVWPLMVEKCRDGFWFGSLPVAKGVPSRRDFLVLRSKHVPKYNYLADIQFTLLLLDWTDNSVATRAGILTLSIEAGLGEFWKFANVRRGAFWMI